MRISIISIIGLLLFFNAKSDLTAQEIEQNYTYLSLKQFMNNRIDNDTNLVKEIYRNITYPRLARDLEFEDLIEIIVFSHPDKEYEVIIKSQSILFNHLRRQIIKAFKKLNINQETPFVTRFKIRFDIDKPKYSQALLEKFHLGLVNYDTFSILDYKIGGLIDTN